MFTGESKKKIVKTSGGQSFWPRDYEKSKSSGIMCFAAQKIREAEIFKKREENEKTRLL
jgi:hypothetical protein